MPQQLIYTSAQRGLVAGRSGYCTVARSAGMRDALMLRLEQFSHYHHVSLTGGQERPIFACRIVDIRGTRFHVLSRVQDAGLDFTNRTNFIAHHLVFTPEEIGSLPAPGVILRDWPGWLKSWNEEPRALENEDWSALTALGGKSCLPAASWRQVTGEAVNACSLLEVRPGTVLRVDELPEAVLLGLLAESAELAEVREVRGDSRAAAWQQTFTTSLQERDDPSEFGWRCLYKDSPALAKFDGAECPALVSLRAVARSDEEARLAEGGWQKPVFRTPPGNLQAQMGQPATLKALAEGVPAPSYQWYAADPRGSWQIIAGQTGSNLVVASPSFGKTRYRVKAINRMGEDQAEGSISVNQTNPQGRGGPGSALPARQFEVKIEGGVNPEKVKKMAEQILSKNQAQAAEQQKLEAQAEQATKERDRSIMMLMLVILAVSGFVVWKMFLKHPAASVSVAANVSGATNSPADAGTNGNVSNNLTPLLATNTPATTVSNAPAVTITNAADSKPIPPPAIVSADKPIQTNSNFGPIPAFWHATNVGSVFTPPIKTLVGQTNFLITGGGDNILKPDASFLFVNRDYSNTVNFVVRVSKATMLLNQFGLMLRASEKPDAAFVFIGTTYAGGSSNVIIFAYRTETGGVVTPGLGKLIGGSEKTILLRLTYTINTFEGSFSDGTAWISVFLKPNPVGNTNLVQTLSTNYLLGFAVSSGNVSTAVSANFEPVDAKFLQP